MICPNCGHEQPDVFSQCQQCRTIFPAQRPKSPSSLAGASLPSAGSHPSLSAFFGALGAVVVLVGALLWLLSPEGLPVPDGSYVNEKHQFALAPPSDWVMLTADNYREVFEKLGGRFPKNLQKGLSERRIEVGFVKPPNNDEFSPNLNVVVMETDVPELDETQIPEASKALTETFKRALDSYELERTELTTVDELASMQFTSKAGLTIKVADEKGTIDRSMPGWPVYKIESSAEWKTFDLKMTQTLVPGKKRAYIITCTAESAQYPDYRRMFEQMIESFRVLERPSRFGPVVMGALQGGLISATVYLLYYIVTALVGFIKR